MNYISDLQNIQNQIKRKGTKEDVIKSKIKTRFKEDQSYEHPKMPAYVRLRHSTVPSENLERSLFSTPSKNQQKNKRNGKHVSCSKAKEQWLSLTFVLPGKWKLCKSLHPRSSLWPLQGRTWLSSSRGIRLCSEIKVGLSFVPGDAQAIPHGLTP